MAAQLLLQMWICGMHAHLRCAGLIATELSETILSIRDYHGHWGACVSSESAVRVGHCVEQIQSEAWAATMQLASCTGVGVESLAEQTITTLNIFTAVVHSV